MTEEARHSVPGDPQPRADAAPGSAPRGEAVPGSSNGNGAGGDPVRRAEKVFLELRSLLRDALRDRMGDGGISRFLNLRLAFQVQPFDTGERAEGMPAERAFAEDLLERIRCVVEEEANRGAPFPQGRVRCYWCDSFDCPHAPPAGPKTVFAGYGPTGLPLWKDLGALALERRDPRIDDLYRDPPLPLAILQSGRDLVSEQLPIYGKRSGAYRILAQVSVGFLGLPAGPHNERTPVALTFQAVEVERGRQQVHLNVLGRLPDGTDLWRLLEQEPDSRLADALRSARARLKELGLGRRRRGGGRDRGAMAALGRLTRNLDRIFRQRTRRTKHAEDRHDDRERPAAAALRDAISARPEEIFRDVLQSTWVVVGPRSRVHIFNDAGRHITSIVYPGETIHRRTAQGKWRAPTPESLQSFREALARSAGR